MSQAITEFEFIGPDKEPVFIDSVDKLIKIANSIRNSGLPNYRGIRIPIKSGLNIEAWEKYLQYYVDKRVLQYIKFGFPCLFVTLVNLRITKLLTIIRLANILAKYESTLTKKWNWGLC